MPQRRSSTGDVVGAQQYHTYQDAIMVFQDPGGKWSSDSSPLRTRVLKKQGGSVDLLDQL